MFSEVLIFAWSGVRDLDGGDLPPATIGLSNFNKIITNRLYCLACILMIEGAPPDLWKTKGYSHSTVMSTCIEHL